jgi:hypothetical protein
VVEVLGTGAVSGVRVPVCVLALADQDGAERFVELDLDEMERVMAGMDEIATVLDEVQT